MKSVLESRMLLCVMGVSFLLLLASAITGPLRPLYFVEVGADPVQLGLLMALPSAVSILTRVPSGALSRRVGPRRLMLVGVVISVVTTGLFAFVRDSVWFYPLVAVSALSWSIFSPIAMLIVSDRTSPSTRGTVMGLYYTSLGAAMFVGPLITSFLALYLNLRQLFLVSGLIPVLGLALFLILGRPENGRSRPEAFHAEVGDEVDMRGSFARILKNKTFLGLSTARIAFAISMNIFSTLFPVYAEGPLGLTPSLISLLFSVRGITNLLIRMPAGRLSDHIGRRKPFMIGYSIIIVVFVALAKTDSFVLLALTMAVFGVGWGMRVAPSTALISESVSSEDRSLAIAAFMTMWDVGSTIGALIAGFTATLLDTSTLLLICAPVMFAAITFFVLMTRDYEK